MDFASASWEAIPWKSHLYSTWLEAKSHASMEDFASVSQVRLSREILAKHFCRTMNYAIPKPIGDGKHTQIFYDIQHHAMRAYF